MLLGLMALVTSCSYEMPEVVTSPKAKEDVEPDMRTVRLSMVLPTTMGSRAASGENANISRYILEVYEDELCNKLCLREMNTDGDFDLDLDVKQSYYVFGWADEGDKSAYNYDPDKGLINITLKDNSLPTIAHKGKSMVSGRDLSEGIFLLDMKHAVAKVVLQTTTPLAANSAKLEVPTHPRYNAVVQSVMESSVSVDVKGPAADITEASEESPVNVAELYVLADKQEAVNIKLQYTLTPDDVSQPYTKTLSGATIRADRRTVLVGDIAGMRSTKMKIKFNLDSDWDGDNVTIPGDDGEKPVDPDDSKEPDDPSNPYAVIALDGKDANAIVAEINAAVTSGKTNIRLTGPVFDGLFRSQNRFGSTHKYTNIDLSQTTDWAVIGNKLPDNAFFAANVEHVYLPVEVTVLGGNAFYMSGITSIQLPGVTELGVGCFQECWKLTEIDAPKATVIKGNALACSDLRTLKLTAGTIDLDPYAMGSASPSQIDLWLNVSVESEVTASSIDWKGRTWQSITLVNADGSINKVIQ
ncbi:MAG: leucine-rich repeat domain-containing protein [Muribaculaceae bacterium]|nr:leucine-rich repeat domain-containing protein [Muribaculaceae bacterium]